MNWVQLCARIDIMRSNGARIDARARFSGGRFKFIQTFLKWRP